MDRVVKSTKKNANALGMDMDIWINLFVNQRYLLNDGPDVGPRADWKTGSPQCGNIYYCS